MKINDMRVGQSVSSSLVLASAAIRQTKGFPPKDYLTVGLTDGADSLEGKNVGLQGCKRHSRK